MKHKKAVKGTKPLTHYQKNKKYYKRYNKIYYLKKIIEDPDYNKKLNRKRKLKLSNKTND